MKTTLAPPQTSGLALGPAFGHAAGAGLPDPTMPLRRLFLLVLLLSWFALSLGVMFRAHRELGSVPPGDREATEVAAVPLAP
jgi:hypothetical protein